MFTHVLVPIDLSEDSRISAHHAAALVARTGGRLSLLHVDEVSGSGLASAEALAIHMQQLSAYRERWVHDLEHELRERYGVASELHLTIGSASREIIDFIEHAEPRIELVVLGRRGLGGVERFLLGSTSKRVVTHAEIPALVVPVPEGDIELPVKAYRRVLTATDFSEDATRGILAVEDLCTRIGAEQAVAHVSHVPMLAAAGGEPPFVMPMETRGELREAAERDLDRLLTSLDLGHLDRRAAVATSVPSALLSTAAEVQADIVAVPTHGKGAVKRMLFGSTTLRMLNHAHIPLLVMPRRWLRATYGQDAD